MTHFVQFYLNVASYFLSWGKIRMWHGDEAVMKMHKKIKIGIKRYIFCYNCRSIVNLKLKFWSYFEKNMGFYLAPKKHMLPVVPWEMKMQWEHTTLNLIVSDNFDTCCNIGLHVNKDSGNSTIDTTAFWLERDRCHVIPSRNTVFENTQNDR